jgi:hypothetical protein
MIEQAIVNAVVDSESLAASGLFNRDVDAAASVFIDGDASIREYSCEAA